jgi:hypothetical protein
MKLLLALAAAASLVSCATSGKMAPPAARGTVDHVVFMWLKRPGNAADRAAVLAACEKLRVIPGAKFLDTGAALPSDRPVVDDSFDVGLIVRFESAATMNSYLTDPRHVKQLTEVLKPKTRKILVYDIAR